MKFKIFSLVLSLLVVINSYAQRSTAECEIAQTSSELNINNVRTTIYSIGDMWWDIQQGKAKYEVPKGGGVHALFAGSIWIGGKDSYGQVKVATTMFRQRGVDFAPGPLNQDGQTSIDVCREYDKMLSITKEEVKEFRAWWQCYNDPTCNDNEFDSYTIPDIILNWPAHGPEGGYDMYLAPFWDYNEDGYYNPYDGDFPYFEFPEDSITDDIDCIKSRNKRQSLRGDQAIWFVFNDAGKEHSNSDSEKIGLEIRAVAYAYSTNTPINDLTFYNYEIINRSTETLYETYVGFWTDADLGYAKDDYVGCDVGRGLGYIYNGDENDETAEGISGYGAQPPAAGIDIFEGLFQDNDGQDNETSYEVINGVRTLNCELGDIMNGNINGLNFEDGVIDNERWGATSFMYFNCGGCGNPSTIGPVSTQDYYNYLRAYWTDNTHMLYDGTGHSSYVGTSTVPTNYMFPGNPTSDICGYGQNGIIMSGWYEETASNPAGDRRFVISNGPITLAPGAVNNLTMGVVYARATSGGAYASVEAMKRVDDIAQNLFDNCFRVLDGPDAPNLTIMEDDKKLFFFISNNPTSNNYLEQYTERDYNIQCDESISPCDEYYKFQGYQIFQLQNPEVNIFEDKHNPELVQQIFQCDIEDSVRMITNFYYNPDNEQYTPVTEVIGNNEGISHSFAIEKDYFTTDNDSLTNQKDYYYTVLAYGNNKTMQFNANNIDNWFGNKNAYIAGENNVKTYTATPHNPGLDNYGTVYNTEYGFCPQITMTEGHGNANQIIELTDECINEIMSGSPWRVESRTYKNAKGPINVKIIDPLNIPADNYTLKFIDVSSNSTGIVGTVSSELSELAYIPFNYCIYNSAGDTVYSDFSISYDQNYEQLFPDWGFSIDITQQNFAGAKDKNEYQNGFLQAEMIFDNPDKPWLDFIKDQEYFDEYNWIRVGNYENKEGELTSCGSDNSYNDLISWDDNEYYENILEGSWAPYRFTNSLKYGVSLTGARNFQNIARYEPLSSVDLVITSDQSKWTRCCVVEMHENEWGTDECGFENQLSPIENYLSIGNAHKLSLRQSPSVDKDGNPDDSGTHGMSWFPGYAIDHRTGERLNIVFGEDSWMASENGQDMKWNPTSSIE